ncbi:MAG: T9SS type A sorting domain-containing protein [Bacteroidota bacterium]|nr:T9SS type A sorting domain-containing protein [Bacteroidota bacterium]
MKKIALIYFLLVCVSFTLAAQEYFHFPDSTAIWNIYYDNCIYYDEDEIRFGMQGDTIIDSFTYNKIYYLTDTILENHESYYCGLREENKRIFVKFNDEEEQLLYDFNLEVGDSIKYNHGGAFFNNNGQLSFTQLCDTFYRKVVNIDTVSLYDGSQRRHYVLEGTGDPSYITDEWIEGIGSSVWTGLFNPFVVDMATNGDGWSPICVKINGDLIYLGNSPCGDCFCLYVDVNEEKVGTKELSVYPNPVNNNLVFEFSSVSQKTILLYDITGKKIKEYHTASAIIEINISDLKKGFYIFKTKHKGKTIKSGTFIKN